VGPHKETGAWHWHAFITVGGKRPLTPLDPSIPRDDVARAKECARETSWKAGVRRPELHEGSPTRKPLTWHDLRATGATWMAVRADDPLKIKQRCGHTTFTTTEIYIREAEAVREGFGEVFPVLPKVLIQFRADQNRSLRSSLKGLLGGVDGTRTRGLRRDRPAL
jgi:hypothetical protein